MTALSTRQLGERGNKTATEQARQRLDLLTLPLNERIQRIIHPTPELAAYRIKKLLFPSRTAEAPFPWLTLSSAFLLGAKVGAHGHFWNLSTRLRGLTVHQRRLLMRSVLELAPEGWEAA